jgi:hypothetical protein
MEATMPRVDWRKVGVMLAGRPEAEAKGPSEAPGRQMRPDNRTIPACGGCECPMPPPSISRAIGWES